MSFLITAALAVALLIAAPITAHLLRRGRTEEQVFPPAKLVMAARPIAEQRSRLQDRALLFVRGLMVLLLAILGATPFVQCSRLSLSRTEGASLALSLVVDDSMSMQARIDGVTRFERAIEGAEELLNSAREGDSVAIVLAGKPARLELAATTDLSAARAALSALRPSDRSTDLDNAVQIARSSLKQLPHVDKRVVLLSDLAGDLPEASYAQAELWAPLPILSKPVANCGVVEAELHGNQVDAVVACTSAAAAKQRSLELRLDETESPKAKQPLRAIGGEQHVRLKSEKASGRLQVALTGSDALGADDTAPVVTELEQLGVGIVADPANASVKTGGPTVIEQALVAMEAEVSLRPLPVVPDEANELEPLSALVLDDPPGLTPAARAVVKEWVEAGGVALALLGPNVEAAPLSANFEPFVEGPVHWEATTEKGADGASLAWLGNAGMTLSDLAASHRVELKGALPNGTRVLGRFPDGAPFLAERELGAGLLFTTSLPVSVDRSDFALRPGFLALLDHVLSAAEQRTGRRRTEAGVPWYFAPGKLTVRGPNGELAISESGSKSEGKKRRVIPDLHGRYVVERGESKQERFVILNANEITAKPEEAKLAAAQKSGSKPSSRFDASKEVALLLLGLIGLELGLRVLGNFKARRLKQAAAS